MTNQTNPKANKPQSRTQALIDVNMKKFLDDAIKEHENSKKARKRRSLKCIGDRQELSKPEACYVVGVDHEKLDALIADGAVPKPFKKRPIPLWDRTMLIQACDEMERAKDEELESRKRRLANG